VVESPSEEGVKADRTLDATGLVVMPGGVDMHCHIAGPKVNTARKIVSYARQLLGINFVTAKELLKMKQDTPKITTGSKNLDSILGGGIEPRTVTEFFGEFGSGKTQICHQVTVNAFLQKGKGGVRDDNEEMTVVYLDTEGTFSPNRIVQMSERWGLDPEYLLDHIKVVNMEIKRNRYLKFSTSTKLSDLHGSTERCLQKSKIGVNRCDTYLLYR